jgi:predicted ATPase/DNA-binding SARP family transcriptional activator
VVGPGGPLPVTQRNERKALVLLAAWEGRVVSSERLVDAIWGDEPPRSSTKVVQNLVMRLRKVLGPDAIETQPTGYVLRASDAVDSRRFERLIAEGRLAAEDCEWEASARALANALSLWRGDPLVDLGTWAPGRWERARLDEQHRGAAEELAEAELARGKHREQLAFLHKLVSEEPLRERGWALLMVALYRCGQQAEALRAFQRARTSLGEVGLAPGAELLSLERAISARDLSLGPEILGRLSLTGLAEPDAARPALAGLEGQRRDPSRTFANNLPVQLTSFVGRGSELAGVAAALHDSRLVTVTGAGGVGKTRLALRVAADALCDYPHGSWFCELAPAASDDDLARVVAAAVGARIRPDLSAARSVIDHIRDTKLLILLDNCEHLLDATAQFAEALLVSCPRLRILTTTRERLGVAGEQVWPLGPLSLPEASGLGPQARSEAATLFADRAGSAKPAFTISTANAEDVDEICRRLDGVPLAIELAAARIPSMNPAEIVARLDERFRLLTLGPRAAVERHQTLRATIDWSFSLCSPAEKRIFARLGVFPGTFDSRAAEAVAAGEDLEPWDVVDALASLVAKSMVVSDGGTDGDTRYSMLETLRAYARERLDEDDDANQWHRRHAEHYADFAERAGVALEGPDELVWHERVRTELDNLRAAIGWALDSSPTTDAQLGLRIVGTLAYAAVIDMTSGVGEWTARAVPRVHETTPGLRTAILGAAAIQAVYVGDYERAQRLALDALHDGLPSDCPVPAPAYSTLATVELSNGRPEEALSVVRRGLEDLERAIGADHCKASIFHSLISVFSTYLGDIATARAEADEALRLARLAANPSASATALWALGKALLRADPAAALAAYEGYIALARSGAKTSILGWSLGDVGWLKARAGDRRGALCAARDGIRLDLRSGNRTMLAGTLCRTKLALVELGYPEPAADLAGAEQKGPLAAWKIDESAAELQDREHALRALGSSLGPRGYERAATLGSTMAYDEIVGYTLNELERLLADRGV